MAGPTEKTRDERFIDAFLTTWEVLDKTGKDPSDRKIDAYKLALSRFTIEQVESAFSRAIVECEWFPTPKSLIEFVQGSPQEIADNGQIEACKVLNAIKRVGGYQSVIFDDPVTTAVIKEGFGGWVRLCTDQREDDEKWFIKDFARMYGAFNRQERKCLEHLPGRVETENVAGGHTKHLPAPVAIGDDGRQLLLN